MPPAQRPRSSCDWAHELNGPAIALTFTRVGLDAAMGLSYQGMRSGQSDPIAHREPTMSVDTSGGHPAMDYKEHVRTYEGFIKGTVILVVSIIVLLIGMAVFLV